MGSAAVLLAIIIALITWGTLLWSHFDKPRGIIKSLIFCAVWFQNHR
jgi:hypothetical protein